MLIKIIDDTTNPSAWYNNEKDPMYRNDRTYNVSLGAGKKHFRPECDPNNRFIHIDQAELVSISGTDLTIGDEVRVKTISWGVHDDALAIVEHLYINFFHFNPDDEHKRCAIDVVIDDEIVRIPWGSWELV